MAVIYAYFDYKIQEEQNPSLILSILFRQLLLHLPCLPAEIEKHYEKFILYGSRPDYNTFLELFGRVGSQFSSVFVLFDAFDECTPNYQRAIYSLIQQFTLLSYNVMVTSRPHLEILQALSSMAIQLEIKANDDDVSKYLAFRLRQQNHISNGLQEKILNELCYGAMGMYIP